MDENFEIEIQETSDTAEGRVQLPMNFITVGEIENDDVKVYIKQDVYKALEKYALADVEHERGTIILGDYSKEHGKTHVIISEYIEARYTDASASTLTFTHETWDYVNREHDGKYPDTRIVGWQHTHPSYGIFLSNYDLFIQENFFNMPFQVAYVIDPIQNTRGFFQWKNGRIEKLKGFYIYDEVGKPVKIAQKRAEEKAVEAPAKANKGIYAVVALLCLTTIISLISGFWMIGKYKAQLQTQEEILAEISSQGEIIENQEREIEKLQEQLTGGVSGETGQITAADLSDLIEKIESHEILLQNQEEVINELKELAEKKDPSDDDLVSFRVYTVAPGDTLEKICADNGVDYYKNLKIILAINDIENVNELYVGQTILLPLSD